MKLKDEHSQPSFMALLAKLVPEMAWFFVVLLLCNLKGRSAWLKLL